MELQTLLLGFGKSLLLVVATVLPVLNPLAIAPVFVGLTEGLDHRTRGALARQIGVSTTILLVASVLVGSYVLRFFGISLPVVRAAGGLVVASIAWHMLNAQQATNPDKEDMARAFSRDEVRTRAFYPLTFPLTCGPGAISVAIAVGAGLNAKHVVLTAANFAGGLVGMVVVAAIVAVTYRYADFLVQRLGRVGTIVLLRLMAFLLLCIGIDMMWLGLADSVSGLAIVQHLLSTAAK
ncbi:MAG TPA: MarC family protein [Nevskiaceae bacterium]